LPVPEILSKLTGGEATAALLLYGTAGFVALVVLVVLWQVFGAGPRRRRGLKRARQRLKEGAWQDALERVRKLRPSGTPSAAWRKRFDHFEAECLDAAAKEALDDERYEEALEHRLKAAHLLERPEHEVRGAMQALMLAEVRQLYSQGLREGDTRPVSELIARTLQVQSPCREASFWQALCDLRNGLSDQALANLEIARTGAARVLAMHELDDRAAPADAPAAATSSPFIDPPLYLGAVLLRRGQPKDAMRFLTEANRMDASCPVVTLQLGAAMVAAGADTQFAVRALQRALGPRGLAQWADSPQRAWVEAFPEHRSYVRKLASEHSFVCPLWGPDLRFLVRQGELALAQGQFRLGNYQESAGLFDRVLKEGAPTHEVLRGLGLSLARLGRYDDAFKHLRTAHEMEQTKDRLTAGYLALCGACGTPASDDDRRQNIAWAVRTLTQFNAPGDPEWAGVVSRVFAEARRHGVPLEADDQIYLCEHLVSVSAADPDAAGAFHHLAATHPHLLHPEYAWLFCRADQQHDVGGEHALALYARTFADPAAARDFFEQRQWDFDAVEYSYLRRAAQLAPGRFPAALGPDYPVRGERLLLERS
jgi:tetratricopeptide (TPR) repeat protein